MLKIIAVCFNIPNLEALICDPSLGKRYPGAGWMPHLVRIALDQEIIVLSGDQALKYVQHGIIDPANIDVIQEEMNQAGFELIALGAQASILTCLESPIFTPAFYDRVESLKAHFKHSILFHGGTHPLYFPSFDNKDLKAPKDWSFRNFLCMVTSNKHYRMLPRHDGPSWGMALKGQLHDQRYLAIDYFKNRPGFGLYGKNWGGMFPECDIKLDTIREYRFNLAFENGVYPGYVTEKCIDALVAGCIPVYKGAEDRCEKIPENVLINADLFDSYDQMDHYLREMSEERALRLISNAQAWLRSEEGQRFECENWARRVLELLV
jgi:hypothetical protein